MAKQPYSRHIIKLNPEQIETLIREASSYQPFYAPERSNLLAILFNEFFIPCADIHPLKDKIEPIPSLELIAKDDGLIGYFAEYNNMIVRLTSKNRNFITLANPTAIDAILKMEKQPDLLTFGDSFIVPEEICEPGSFAMLNILFEEYLWETQHQQNNMMQVLGNLIQSYMLVQEMWKYMPKIIQPFYSYLDPLAPAEIFAKLGYPEAVIKEIELAIVDYRNLKDKEEGDFDK